MENEISQITKALKSLGTNKVLIIGAVAGYILSDKLDKKQKDALLGAITAQLIDKEKEGKF